MISLSSASLNLHFIKRKTVILSYNDVQDCHASICMDFTFNRPAEMNKWKSFAQKRVLNTFCINKNIYFHMIMQLGISLLVLETLPSVEFASLIFTNILFYSKIPFHLLRSTFLTSFNFSHPPTCHLKTIYMLMTTFPIHTPQICFLMQSSPRHPHHLVKFNSGNS